MQLNIRAVKGLLELWVDKAAVALANFGVVRGSGKGPVRAEQ